MEKDRLALLRTENQNSSGDLKGNSEKEANQDSGGGLDVSTGNSFISNFESIKELGLQEIQPFTLIPDYLEPTLSKHPIVVKTPKSCHCIEGWGLIEKAKSAGDDKIRCHVSYFQEASEDELAIRKVAIRTLPQGGKSSYAERVRNMQILFKHLMETSKNPHLCSHGGDRKSAEFANNKEDDMRQLMAKRTGMPRDTVSKCLNYAEYIGDKDMEVLVASKAERYFFEEAQKNKRILIKNLRHTGEPEDSMTTQISTAILKWLKEYKELGTIKSILHLSENFADGTDGGSPSGIERAVHQPGRKFEHTVKNGDGSEEEEPSTETIQNELMEAAHRITGLVTTSNMTVRQLLEEVKAVLTDLTQVHAKLVYLDHKQVNGSEGR